MKDSVYEAEYENELSHWWFVARREMFMRIISEWSQFRDLRYLDVGTSTGTNLRMLSEANILSRVGLEINPIAAQMARLKTESEVVEGSCTAIPFNDNSFDVVLATDVIEHIHDHELALKEIFRVIRPGGHAIFTVPAFMHLWGLQDDLSQHCRRYRRNEFRNLVSDVGFSVKRVWYFNFFLAPIVLILRQVFRLCKIQVRSEGDVNSPTINRVALSLFRLDCRLSQKVHFPYGVSIALISQKPNI